MQEVGLEKELEEIYGNPAYRATKELCYIDLVDEQTPLEKQTITYFTDKQNFARIQRKLMRTKKIDEATAGDIMIDVYEELSRKEDYQLMWDSKDPNKIIPLEGYVSHIVNICVKRHFSKVAKVRSYEVPNIVSNSNVVEEDLFDFIPDNSTGEQLETYEYDLESAIDWAKRNRYIGSCDMLAMVYIRLITTNTDSFNRLSKLMGISQEAESKLENLLKRDEDGTYFIKTVANNRERSIKALEKYVYGARLMKKAVSIPA